MTRKKSLWILLAIVGLSALLFSQFLGIDGKRADKPSDKENEAAAAGAEGDARGAKETLRAQVSMEPKEFELFQQLAKQFADAHEGIAVQVENVPAKEAYEKWKKASQMAEAPDLMLLDNAWVHEFAALGFLQPVDEFFSGEQQSQRFSAVMNQVKWNGYIWGVPKDIDPYILAWNKKAAAELKTNHSPETPEELAAWNKALLKPEEGKYGVYVDPNDTMGVLSLVSSLTGAWLQGEKLWPNEAEAQKTLESFLAPQEDVWTGKLLAKNYPLPDGNWSSWDLLNQGKIGILVTTVSAFRQNAGEDVGIAALPAVGGKENGVWLKGRSFVISSRTQNAKLLIDWVKDMTMPETEIKFWNEARMLPAQIPSYALNPLREDDYIQSYDWLIRQGKVLPASADVPKNMAALQNELQRLWKGESSVKQWVEAVAKAWTFPARKS